MHYQPIRSVTLNVTGERRKLQKHHPLGIKGRISIANADTRLEGYWRWASMHIEFADGGPNIEIYGSAPEGGVIFTPSGRIMAIIAASGRKPAETDVERAALFRSFAAYTGKFRLEEGGRFVTNVDAIWDPA